MDKKKAYADSFNNTNTYSNYNNPFKEDSKLNPLKTLETKESELIPKFRSRHHTQPRTHMFGTAEYSDKNKPASIAQTRAKNGSNTSLTNSNAVGPNLASIRREYQTENYKHIPHSTPAKFSKKLSSKSKRNGMNSGASILAGVPNQNKIQLQGFTIRPDSKYTSLAEVHNRGYFAKK